jgi:beta-hydroxylase
LFSALRQRREKSRGFKQRHRKLFKGMKFAGALAVLWILLLAPWPLLR